jgi:eukaryotic-like serine/threonine-protein kinase
VRRVEADAPAPGYRVLEHLSRGSVLDAYAIWSEERDCLCVAKVLRPDRLADPKSRRRLRAEGRLLIRLTHPHIVRAYELWERPHPVLILEALQGETLAHLIAARGRLPVADVAFLGLHLCSAMAYLHRQGFLHLDLKPSNIVSECGQVRVIDFSVARPGGRVRRAAGTHVYMAPEQARGGTLGPASDVWGIGAVVFEAAVGLRPFAVLSRDSTYPQLDGRPDPVGAHRRLPRELAAAIDACLDQDPNARPTTAELAAALRECVDADFASAQA